MSRVIRVDEEVMSAIRRVQKRLWRALPGRKPPTINEAVREIIMEAAGQKPPTREEQR